MSIPSVIGGLALIGGGLAITIKSEAVYSSMGPIAWAEDKMASMGGSRMFYRLFGLGLSLVGILMATNLVESLILAPLTSLFVRSKPL